MTFVQKLDLQKLDLQKLTHAAGVTERRLDALLSAQSIGGTGPARLLDAMRHAVLGGGKRFRPFLVLQSAELFGVPETAAIDTAAALECVHCYSLAHDDLPAMDNDTLRRGLPTVWHAFDEWTAILAGDALLTMAFEILATEAAHPDAAIRAELIRGLAGAAGARGMVGGQALDLEAEKRIPGGSGQTLDAIRKLQSMKTGALIRFAGAAGPILAGAPAADRQRLEDYGEALGFAFQIADDLLDVEGSAEETGKAVAKDAARGKATLVSLMGIDAARAKLAQLEAEAIELLAPYGRRAETLREAVAFAISRRR